MKYITPILLFLAAYFAVLPLASAHVVVTPSQVNIGEEQVFSISVPNEQQTLAMTGLRLGIPIGVTDVTPTIKPGWGITFKKNSNGDITELDWTGGSLPAGERDEFSFSAQVPASATSLNWKAYQTFSDNSVVAWDQAPTGTAQDETGNPFSVTKVINDLTATPALTPTPTSLPLSRSEKGIAILSTAALALSALAISFSFRRR